MKQIKFLFFIVIFVSSVFYFPLYSQSQQTSDQIRQKANAYLSQGDFEAAIEYLLMLIERHADTKQEAVKKSMENIYYNLGIAYFFTARFEEADKAFQEFIKRYPTGHNVPDALVYIADSLRFRTKINDALKAYENVLAKYKNILSKDMKTDIYCAMVRCKISQDKWFETVPYLKEIVQLSPDTERRNWAYTIWTIVYLKKREIEKVFDLTPFLLQRDSFASRSIALNMATLEAADDLFAEEQYREALWLYRLVYPQDMLTLNVTKSLSKLEAETEVVRKQPNALRALMRLQERIGETENELKLLDGMQNYDLELYSRIARSYMKISRFREARELFLYLYVENEGEAAEEYLYLAFRCSLSLRPFDRAFELGEQYMEKYPSGEYFDAITMTMGQIYAMLQDWPKVIEHLKKALEIHPQHQDAAECYFLIAYASFMEEDFQQTIDYLTKMNTEFPHNERKMDGLYWLGMARMFSKDYKQSALDFDDLLTQFPGSIYTEDATYRRAVCDFALSKMEEAQKRFKEFIASYPKSKLIGEAYMMLGDIAAFFGEIKEAVKLYQEVANHEINIELYNYAMFRCGEFLFGEETKYSKEENKYVVDYDAVIKHFNRYISINREGSNIPQAILYIGRSLWNKGEKAGALERYLEAIKEYGDDVNDIGTDLIVEEWIGKARSIPDATLKERMWKDFEENMAKAESEGKRVLSLRLKRALLYKDKSDEEGNKKIRDDIVQEKNLFIAGPSTLEFIMDEALKDNNIDLATKAANRIVEAFTETDYALSARVYLAKEAIKSKDYKTALVHLGVIREVFATNIQAAEALIMMGDIYMEEKKFAEADECYKSVLAVKEWKGKLWPQALLGRGQAAIAMGKLSEACAYFERIYLMYSFYKQYAAKAYLARARTLAKLREYNKAVETLRDMMHHEELSGLPEWKEAKTELENLEKRI